MQENCTERNIIPVQDTETTTKSSEDEVKKTNAETFQLIAKGLIEFKKQELEISGEIEKIRHNNKNNLAKMDNAYAKQKSGIDNLLKGLDVQYSKLNAMDVNNLTEIGHQTFQTLLFSITSAIDRVTHLYDNIMG